MDLSCRPPNTHEEYSEQDVADRQSYIHGHSTPHGMEHILHTNIDPLNSEPSSRTTMIYSFTTSSTAANSPRSCTTALDFPGHCSASLTAKKDPSQSLLGKERHSEKERTARATVDHLFHKLELPLKKLGWNGPLSVRHNAKKSRTCQEKPILRAATRATWLLVSILVMLEENRDADGVVARILTQWRAGGRLEEREWGKGVDMLLEGCEIWRLPDEFFD